MAHKFSRVLYKGNGRCCYFRGSLVYFMTIWYILWPFGIFYPVLVCCVKKSGNLVSMRRCCFRRYLINGWNTFQKSHFHLCAFKLALRGKVVGIAYLSVTSHEPIWKKMGKSKVVRPNPFFDFLGFSMKSFLSLNEMKTEQWGRVTFFDCWGQHTRVTVHK
jgi:hypothetical protein